MHFMKTLLAVTLLLPTACFAAHPLISDDAGTQGQGRFQLEVNSDNGSQTTDGVQTKINIANTTLTYGLTDTVDIAANVAYQRIREGASSTSSGMGDSVLFLKWRFYENNGWSLALKPQVSLPNGDEKAGIGNGRIGYGLNTLATYVAGNFTMLGNAGYIYNDNSIGKHKNLWSASAALLVNVNPKTRLAFDVGAYRNSDPLNNQNPAFSLVGFIYSPFDALDFDMGFKKGLNKSEIDKSFGVGMTYRF